MAADKTPKAAPVSEDALEKLLATPDEPDVEPVEAVEVAPPDEVQPIAPSPKRGPKGRLMGRHCTKEEVEDRRRRVYDLRLAGISIAKIAALFKVHPNTIIRDCLVLRREQADKLKKVDVNAELGGHIRFLEKISEESLTEAASTESGKEKSQALNTALKARQLMMQLQIDTGVLPKANPKADVEELFSFDGRDIRQMGPAELNQALHEIQAKMAVALEKEKAESASRRKAN